MPITTPARALGAASIVTLLAPTALHTQDALSGPTPASARLAKSSFVVPTVTYAKGVSCLGAEFCMAVGGAGSPSGAPSPLVMLWQARKMLNPAGPTPMTAATSERSPAHRRPRAWAPAPHT